MDGRNEAFSFKSLVQLVLVDVYSRCMLQRLFYIQTVVNKTLKLNCNILIAFTTYFAKNKFIL